MDAELEYAKERLEAVTAAAQEARADLNRSIRELNVPDQELHRRRIALFEGMIDNVQNTVISIERAAEHAQAKAEGIDELVMVGLEMESWLKRGDLSVTMRERIRARLLRVGYALKAIGDTRPKS